MFKGIARVRRGAEDLNTVVAVYPLARDLAASVLVVLTGAGIVLASYIPLVNQQGWAAWVVVGLCLALVGGLALCAVLGVALLFLRLIGRLPGGHEFGRSGDVKDEPPARLTPAAEQTSPPDPDLAGTRAAVAAFVHREMADAFGAANALLREVAPPPSREPTESAFIGHKMHTLWLAGAPRLFSEEADDPRLASLSSVQLRTGLVEARIFYARMCRDLLDLLAVYGREKDPALTGRFAVWSQYNGRADVAFEELTERPALRDLGRRYRGRWTDGDRPDS